jgi:hypothetical protein
MYKFIAEDRDHDLLQQGLTNLHQWSDKWLLKLNNKKCKVMSIGRNILNKSDYSLTLDGSNLYNLSREEHINDLGVEIDEKLDFHIHMHNKINKAYMVLGIIKRNFTFLTGHAFVLLYKSMVCSVLEYNNSVWSPYKLNIKKPKGFYLKSIKRPMIKR